MTQCSARATIRQPGAPSGGSFSYGAMYVFAGPCLVQVMCQYDRARTVIATGCTHLLATLRLALALRSPSRWCHR